MLGNSHIPDLIALSGFCGTPNSSYPTVHGNLTQMVNLVQVFNNPSELTETPGGPKVKKKTFGSRDFDITRFPRKKF